MQHALHKIGKVELHFHDIASRANDETGLAVWPFRVLPILFEQNALKFVVSAFEIAGLEHDLALGNGGVIGNAVVKHLLEMLLLAFELITD